MSKEKLVMLHVGSETAENLEKLCRHVLPRYWVPRAYLRVSEIPLTETGKKARVAARELAAHIFQKG